MEAVVYFQSLWMNSDSICRLLPSWILLREAKDSIIVLILASEDLERQSTCSQLQPHAVEYVGSKDSAARTYIVDNLRRPAGLIFVPGPRTIQGRQNLEALLLYSYTKVKSGAIPFLQSLDIFICRFPVHSLASVLKNFDHRHEADRSNVEQHVRRSITDTATYLRL